MNPTRIVDVRTLKPHPKNYKIHTADQLEQIKASVSEHGFYREIVVANDDVVLAGHGLRLAVIDAGLIALTDSIPAFHAPIIQLPIPHDDPRALKVLVGDNEIGKGAETDYRLLSDTLKDLLANDLVGTGYDAQSLAALVFVTRNEDEIESKDEAAEWVGMPEFDAGKQLYRLTVMFRSDDDRKEFVKKLEGFRIADRSKNDAHWSGWWPPMAPLVRQSLLWSIDEEPAQS